MLSHRFEVSGGTAARLLRLERRLLSLKRLGSRGAHFMNRVHVLVLVTVVSCMQTASSKQQSGNGSTSLTVEQCPDTHAWTGKYKNSSYGFSIVIPEGYQGFWNSARCLSGADGCTCMSDHGRIIPLSHEPYEDERHIEAYASHGAELDEPTVAQAVTQRLTWIRKRGRRHSLTVRKRLGVTVAGRRGERVVVSYYDKRTRAWLVEDFIELLKDGDEYSLYLRTPRTDYEHDRHIFEVVVASFAFEKPGDTSNEMK